MEYFEKLNKNNEMWGLMTEQVLLGQINPIGLKTNAGMKVKTKNSIIIIDKSSTGKGLLQTLLEYAVERINKEVIDENHQIKVDDLIETQEAGLSGTVVDGKIKYGKLKNYDIIIFPEASTLFQKTIHKKTMITTLQCAIERCGRVNKIVRGEELKYDTDVSFVLCSVPFEGFYDSVAKDGLFQRCFVSFNSKSFDEIGNIFMNSRLCVTEKEDYKETFKGYVSIIKKAFEFSEYTPRFVIIPDCINETITKKIFDIFKEERKNIITELNRNIFDSYLQRVGENIDKMAVNVMFRDMKRELDLECYDIPLKIYKHHLYSIKTMLNGTIPKPNATGQKYNRKEYDKERVLKTIKEHKGNITELYRSICRTERVGMNTAIKIYKEVTE